MKIEESKQLTEVSKTTQLIKKITSSLRRLYYLELLLFVHNFAQGLRNATYFPLIYAKVCQSLYTERSLNQCQYSAPSPDYEKRSISAETAKFLMYCDLANFVPNLLTGAFFGAYGDRFGQKMPTVVTLASMVVHTWLYALLCVRPEVPPFTIVVESGLLAIFGGKTVFMASQFSEACRQTEVKDKLSERFAIMAACSSFSTFLACMLSSILVKYSTNVEVQIWGETVLVVCFVLAFLMHTDLPEGTTSMKDAYPTVARAVQNGTLCSVSIVHFGLIPDPSLIFVYLNKHPERKMTTCQMFLSRVIEMYQDLWVTLHKPRPDRRRLHLFALCAIALIYACVDFGMERITTLYAYGEPLQWTVSAYSMWTAVTNLVQLAGGLLGLKIMKRFQLSDHTIIVIGLISAALRMVCLGVASRSWIMYFSVFIGCISSSGLCSLRAVVASLGDPDEMGRLVTTVSMVMSWSGLVSCLLFNNVYSATLNIYPGFTFLSIVPALTVCAGVIALLRYDVNRLKK